MASEACGDGGTYAWTATKVYLNDGGIVGGSVVAVACVGGG